VNDVRLFILLAAILSLAALPAPAVAIVGGTDTPAGKYPAVANVTISGAFGCTGTLIAPDWVLTAGHCSSLTGGLGLATPIAFSPSSFEVVLGTVARSGAGGETFGVDRIVIPSDYLLTASYDTSLLHLTRPSKAAPTPVAGVGFQALSASGVLTEAAGFGLTADGGAAPDVLQQVQLPILPDGACAARYDSFEAPTQLCAGYAEGGRDTCQGDSGGPVFTRNTRGTLYLVGATSYGEGCARPNTPGVYARVSDQLLREFIRSHVPAGVVDAKAGDDTTPAQTYDPVTRTVRTAAPAAAAGTPAAAGSPAKPAGPRTTLTADRTRRRTLRSRGLRVRVGCSSACVARVRLTVDAATAKRLGRSSSTVGRVTLRRSSAGRSTAVVKLPRALARRLTARRRSILRVEADVAERSFGRVRIVRRAVLTGR